MATAIIQARMSSKRLPNKVMKIINNKPLITHVYERVKRSKKIKTIIVACSKSKTDDPLVKLCKIKKYKFFRGSLNNVLHRFVQASKKYNLKYFVRINGDSPCIDPAIIDKAIRLYENKRCDLVTNVYPRSYPAGISVEVINSRIIYDVEKYKKITEKNKEHVTSYFYEHNKEYSIINFRNKKNCSNYNLAIDTLKHLKKIEQALRNKNFLDFTWKKILKLIYNYED